MLGGNTWLGEIGHSNNLRHFKCCEPPRILQKELSTRNLTKKSVENNEQW